MTKFVLQSVGLDDYRVQLSLRDPDSDKYAAMLESIRRRLHLTTLKFQRLPDLVEAIGLPKTKLCTYCWDGCEGCASKSN